MSRARVLVVDDEPGVRDLIAEVLQLDQYEVAIAIDGLEALNLLRKASYDLIILDISMPKLDGLGLLEKIRAEKNDVPVLMLSARNDRKDIATGLRLGADDYVTKPFGIEELVLRVKAILRRTQGEVTSRVLQCGPVSLDAEKHTVKFESDLVDLSPTEFSLLEYLLERQGKVVSKEALLAAVWGYDFETNSSVVETYISYLRKKLHRGEWAGIKTIRGIGFQIVASA
jgi:two-component system OmpR family response regulator